MSVIPLSQPAEMMSTFLCFVNHHIYLSIYCSDGLGSHSVLLLFTAIVTVATITVTAVAISIGGGSYASIIEYDA